MCSFKVRQVLCRMENNSILAYVKKSKNFHRGEKLELKTHSLGEVGGTEYSREKDQLYFISSFPPNVQSNLGNVKVLGERKHINEASY